MYWVPMIGVTSTIGQLGDQTIYCIVDALDVDITQNQKSLSNMLGDGALKVYLADESSMVLGEIKLDFKDWYSSKYNNFGGKSNDDWWKYVEDDLKKLFRGIVKLFTRLSPDFSHGNGMRGIPILYGKLYNMKYDGYEGYRRDIKSLHQIMDNVLMGFPPEDGSSDIWREQSQDSTPLYKGSSLKGFDKFMFDLKNIDKQKKQVHWYCPFFWSQKERFYFMEKAYDIFWVERNLIPWDARFKLDWYFPVDWFWWDLVPCDGPYRRVLEYGEDQSKVRYQRRVDSISFWRNSRHHYNDNAKKSEGFKTVEEIEAELNEKFDICSHVFKAICDFIHHGSKASAYRGNGFLSNQCQCLNSLYFNTQL